MKSIDLPYSKTGYALISISALKIIRECKVKKTGIHQTVTTMITAIIPRLPAKDLGETEKFYKEHLDFETVTRQDDYLVLSRNGMELHFYQNRVMNVQKNNAMLYVRVNEHIQSLHDKAMTNPLPFAVLGKLEEKSWGEIEFSLLDPNHNLLTFGQHKD